MLKSSGWLVLSSVCALYPLAASAQSLINPDEFQSLIGDRLGYEIGDALTVLVVESSTAESAAGTGAEAATSIAASASSNGRSDEAALGLRGTTDGSGRTSRRGQIRTNVSVRIVDKLPEGLLRVSGMQELTINDERQKIWINGLVRPDDISYDNTVFSYRLADASIEIVGDGVVSASQKQNIIFRTLKWLRLL